MSDGSDSRVPFWNHLWSKPSNRTFWTQAAPEVIGLFHRYRPSDYPRLLDLGCGLGRNAIAAAKAGYRVTASDASDTAVQHLAEWAHEIGFQIQTRICGFLDDCFQPTPFDMVLAVNVLYHGTRADLTKALRNIHHWLRVGGLLYFTCPSLQDERYVQGRQVAPHTFELQPSHVHYCASDSELRLLLQGFQVLELTEHEHHWQDQGKSLASCRYLVLASRV